MKQYRIIMAVLAFVFAIANTASAALTIKNFSRTYGATTLSSSFTAGDTIYVTVNDTVPNDTAIKNARFTVYMHYDQSPDNTCDPDSYGPLHTGAVDVTGWIGKSADFKWDFSVLTAMATKYSNGSCVSASKLGQFQIRIAYYTDNPNVSYALSTWASRDWTANPLVTCTSSNDSISISSASYDGSKVSYSGTINNNSCNDESFTYDVYIDGNYKEYVIVQGTVGMKKSTTINGTYSTSLSPGTHTLKLELWGGNYNATSSKSFTVTAPVTTGSIAGVLRDCSGSIKNGYAVNLDGVSSSITDGSGNFNFGNVSPGSHTLSVNAPTGCRPYSTTVSVTAGQITTANITLASNNYPTVNAGSDQTVTEGTSVSLVCTKGDPDGDATTAAWYEGTTNLSNNASFSQVFAVGTHTVKCTVTDAYGLSNTDTAVVTVNPVAVNHAPTADAGADQTVTEATLVPLGCVGTDPDGDSLDYVWKEGTTVLSSASSFSKVFAVGTHSLTCTVMDAGNLTGSDTVIVKVNAAVAYCSLGGTVKDAVTGAGLSGASVAIDADSIIFTMVTPAGGAYSFNNLPCGSVSVSASKTGYDSVAITKTLVVNTSNLLDIPLPEIVTTGSIGGQVTDSVTGQPIFNATVDLGGTKKPSDSSGNYRFTGVEKGGYSLTVSKTGYDTKVLAVTVDANLNKVQDVALNKQFDSSAISTESLSSLLATYPIQFENRCTDFGTQTMTYDCIVERNSIMQYPSQGISGEAIGEALLETAEVVWIASVIGCAGGTATIGISATACIETGGLACGASAYVIEFAVPITSASCMIMAGDLPIADIKATTARMFRMARLDRALALIKGSVSGATELGVEANEAGAIYRYSKNGGVTQDIVVFPGKSSGQLIRFTFPSWIGELSGGSELMTFSKGSGVYFNVANLDVSEASLVASTFKTGEMQLAMTDFASSVSFGRYAKNQLVEVVQFLPREHELAGSFGAASSEARLITMDTRFGKLVGKSSGSLTKDQALVSVFEHEFTHRAQSQILSDIAVATGRKRNFIPVGEPNYLVVEYFTDYQATRSLSGTKLSTYQSAIRAISRLMDDVLENPDYHVDAFVARYNSGEKGNLLARYNMAKLGGDQEAVAAIESYFSSSNLQIFRQEAQALAGEIEYIYQGLKSGSMNDQQLSILEKYNILSRTVAPVDNSIVTKVVAVGVGQTATITLPNDVQTTAYFPPDSVQEDTEVTMRGEQIGGSSKMQIAKAYSASNPTADMIRSVVTLEPSGVVLHEPVMLQVRVPSGLVSAQEYLVIMRYDENSAQWVVASDSYKVVFDDSTDDYYVSAPITSFGSYGVMTLFEPYNPPPSVSIPVNGGDSGKSGCFIATAAYGSDMAEEVIRLRMFRDGVLLKSGWGKAFVAFYYKHSPPVADYISDKPLLKLIVRTMLRPLTWLIFAMFFTTITVYWLRKKFAK